MVVNACTLCPGTDLMRRHAGVLGLSACILSSPYDVPTWMPQLLMDLSAHLNDTQPIEVRPAPTHVHTHTRWSQTKTPWVCLGSTRVQVVSWNLRSRILAQ